MNCPSPEKLARLVDADLSDAHAIEVEAHLGSCLPCRRFVEELERTVGALTEPELWHNAGVELGHLDERDMLFALAKAGGGVHLEECDTCSREAQVIEDTVSDFEAQRLEGSSAELQRRLLAVAPRERSHSAGLTNSVSEVNFLAGFELDAESDDASRLALLAGDSGRSEALENAQQRFASELIEPEQRRSGLRRPSGAFKRRTGTGVSMRRRFIRRPTAGPQLFATLAAAAALLLLAVVVSPPNQARKSGRTGPRGTVARGPLVSDLLGRPTTGQPKAPSEGSKASGGAEVDELPLPPFGDVESEPVERRGATIIEDRSGAAGPALASGRHSSTVDAPSSAAEREDPERGEAASKPDSAAAARAFAAREVEDDGSRLQLAAARVVGRLSIRRRDGDWRRVKRGEGLLEVAPGDRLRASSGPVFLSLESGTQLDLCLGERTELRVEGARDGPVLALGSGRLHCEFDRHFTPQMFVLKTPHGALAVGAATLGVEVSEERTITSVHEGRVLCSVSSDEPPTRPLDQGRAYALDGRALDDSLGEARPSRWGRGVRPRHESLLSASFDSGQAHGFTGELLPRGGESGGGLRGRAYDGKYYGQRAHLRKGAMRAFRALGGVKLRFSYRLSEAALVRVQLYNQNQSKYFYRDLGFRESERWQRVTIDLMNDLSTYFAPGKNPVANGDLFNELSILAGPPGSALRLDIDNVEIFRKVYR